MLTLMKKFLSETLLKEYLRRRHRSSRAKSYFKDDLISARAWSKQHTEFSNFYYDLTTKNRNELAALISYVFNVSTESTLEFFNEIDTDQELIAKLSNFKNENPNLRDSKMFLGRRLGWYAIARILKPSIVVETGVHHGVGALVLNRALARNRAEGFEGKYFGTDIDTQAGWLVGDLIDDNCTILYGDSIESIRKFEENSIDLFINDSDHSFDYEFREYSAVESKLSKMAVILGDNAHISDSLLKYSLLKDRNFLYFAEEPLSHWYPGAGIGISLPSK
ncbi:methyltransferase [Candidatus Planktophila dulcis]|nr:methyltransferase [Candidatus Planktophila dulcis]